MSSNEMVVPAAAAQPDRLGQATAVEQSRAVAEVQGAILVAQRCPRNVPGAIAEMEQSCAQKGLAERAFFRFPRAGSTVSGASVYLARELARTWGNVQYGVSEMRRDDEHGQSEMKAFAWDVQTNTRVETTFVVPHIRDTKKGGQKLTDMRDIYENNANAGARRVRECIFSILPPWFVDAAKDLCTKTLTDGGGKPLPQRIADAVAAFEGIGISLDQLERKIDRPTARWNAHDIAQLTVTFKSLQRGEVQKDEEFPPVRVTADEIIGQQPAAEKPASNGAKRGADARAALGRLHAALVKCGVTEETEKLADVRALVGRPVDQIDDLTKDEATRLAERLERIALTADPANELDYLLANTPETVAAP